MPLTARSPPKRRPTPRKRRVGSAFSTDGAASVTDLLDDLVRDDAVLDDLDLALPRQLRLLAGRVVATRCRLRRTEVPTEGLVDVRNVPGDVRRHGPGPLRLRDLQRVLVLDRLATAVELQDALVGDLEARPERARHGLLQRSTDTSTRLVQALDDCPGSVPVVVEEPVVHVLTHEPLARVLHVRGRLLGLQTTRLECPEATEVRPDETRRDGRVGPEEVEEQVARVLLRVDRAVGLLERGERSARVRSTDEPEVPVHLVRSGELADERRIVTAGRRR